MVSGRFPPTTMNRLTSCLALIVLTAATSAAGPTCPQVCRQATSCMLTTFDACMSMCGESTFAETTASTCTELADQIAPSQWVCRGEGASSYGFGVATGSRADVRGTQAITALGIGATRAAAVTKAFDQCSARMAIQLGNQRAMMRSDDRGPWGAAITSECRVSRCTPPAAERNARLRFSTK